MGSGVSTLDYHLKSTAINAGKGLFQAVRIGNNPVVCQRLLKLEPNLALELYDGLMKKTVLRIAHHQLSVIDESSPEYQLRLQIYNIIKNGVDEAMRTAILKDNLKYIVDLFKGGADVVQLDNPSCTNKLGCLGLACDKKTINNEIVKFLTDSDERNIPVLCEEMKPFSRKSLFNKIQEKGSSDLQNDSRKKIENHLFKLIATSDVDAAKMVEKLGYQFFPLNFSNDKSETPIEVAIKNRAFKTISSILRYDRNNIPINIQEANHQITVALNIGRNTEELFKHLNEINSIENFSKHLRNIDKRAVDERGNNILNLALINECSEDILRVILKNSQVLHNVVNDDGLDCIQITIKHLENRYLKILFEEGISLLNPRQINYLEFAKEVNKFEEFEMILTTEMWKILRTAVSVSDMKTFHEVTACGGNPKIINRDFNLEDSSSLMHCAIEKDQRKMIKELFLIGVDIGNTHHPDELTPLHLAILKDKDAIVDELFAFNLPQNLNLSSQSLTESRTALMEAAIRNKLEVVKLLVLNGADTQQKDKSGRTAAALASNKNIAYYLQSIEDIVDELQILDNIPVGDNLQNHPRILQECEGYSLEPQPLSNMDKRKRYLKIVRIDNHLSFMSIDNLNTKLGSAIKASELQDVKSFCNDGADVACSSGSLTPLRLANQTLNKLYNFYRNANFHEGNSHGYEKMQKAISVSIWIQNRLNFELCRAIRDNDYPRLIGLTEAGASYTLPDIDQKTKVKERFTSPFGLIGISLENHDNVDIVKAVLKFTPEENNQVLVSHNSLTSINIAQKYKRHNSAQIIIQYFTLSFKLLLENVTNNDSLSQLEKEQLVKKMEILMKDGALPSINTKEILKQALQFSNYNLFRLTLEKGADPNLITEEDIDRSPNNSDIKNIFLFYKKQHETHNNLVNALFKGDLKFVTEFHRRGCNTAGYNFNGDTFVLWATKLGSKALVEYFLGVGGPLDHRSLSETKSLVEISKNSNNVDLYSLIENEVKKRLKMSIISGDCSEIDILCSSNSYLLADIEEDLLANDNETIGTLAAKNFSIEVFRTLHTYNVNFHKLNNLGEFPLAIAASKGDFSIVEFLVETAGVNVQEQYGNSTAADLAQAKKFLVIAHYLNTGELPEDDLDSKEPLYTLNELLNAVKKANHTIIDEFIDDDYNDPKLKVQHCKQMILCAKRERKLDIAIKLERLAKDMVDPYTTGRVLTLSNKLREVLTTMTKTIYQLIIETDEVGSDTDNLTAIRRLTKERICKTFLSKTDINGEKQELREMAKKTETEIDNIDIQTDEIKESLKKKKDELEKATDPEERLSLRKDIEETERRMPLLNYYRILLNEKTNIIKKHEEILELNQSSRAEVYTFFNRIKNQLKMLYAQHYVQDDEKEKTDDQSENDSIRKVIVLFSDSVMELAIDEIDKSSSDGRKIVSILARTLQATNSDITIDNEVQSEERLLLTSGLLDIEISLSSYRIALFYHHQVGVFIDDEAFKMIYNFSDFITYAIYTNRSKFNDIQPIQLNEQFALAATTTLSLISDIGEKLKAKIKCADETIRDTTIYELSTEGVIITSNGHLYGDEKNIDIFGLYPGTKEVAEKRKLQLLLEKGVANPNYYPQESIEKVLKYISRQEINNFLDSQGVSKKSIQIELQKYSGIVDDKVLKLNQKFIISQANVEDQITKMCGHIDEHVKKTSGELEQVRHHQQVFMKQALNDFKNQMAILLTTYEKEKSERTEEFRKFKWRLKQIYGEQSDDTVEKLNNDKREFEQRIKDFNEEMQNSYHQLFETMHKTLGQFAVKMNNMEMSVNSTESTTSRLGEVVHDFKDKLNLFKRQLDSFDFKIEDIIPNSESPLPKTDIFE
ncbi:DgyrCDS3160 [Dimorphilus gyrociliatus]|uniref:DgyrCDS3160 n=1 Tax=Dimorphilus gyrociliatus TaxID=2664684 RepID=A0A7I8VF38_9ANNE|nr:DgyrCDS3160 [Dimorphilus gyrociliatus]